MNLTILLHSLLFTSLCAALPAPLQNYKYLAKRYDNETIPVTTSDEALTTTVLPEIETTVITDSHGNSLTTTYTLTSTVIVTLDSSSTSDVDAANKAAIVQSQTPSITNAPVASTTLPSSSTSGNEIQISDFITQLQSLGKQANVADIASLLSTSFQSSTCAVSTVTITPSWCATTSSLPSNVQLQEVTMISTDVGTTTVTIPITATMTVTYGSSTSIFTTSTNVETPIENTSVQTITKTNFITVDPTTYVTLTTTSTTYSTLPETSFATDTPSYNNGTAADNVLDMVKRANLW